MLIYIVTFLACIFIDLLKGKDYILLKKFFLIYLYAFFCFGYTTGTDWRYYELLYKSSSEGNLLDRDIEQGFYYFISFIRRLIPDFWLFLGLVKGLYLFYLIRVIKIFTKEYFTILAILMNYQLLFMLVDNPLRFMCGSIFILGATPYLVHKKYLRFLSLGSISLLFHFTLAVPLLLSLLTYYQNHPFVRSKKKLVTVYGIACIISLFPFLITSFREFAATIFPIISNKLLESYLIESNAVNFTIGSLIKLLLFLLFIYKRKIFDRVENGSFIFLMVFIFFTINRVLLTVPTGFRLSLHFSLFLVIGLYFIFKESKYKIKVAILAMVGASMIKTLYASYQYIPYTNSIFYIISNDHQPYHFRDQLNKKEYKKRTGEFVEDKSVIL